MKNRYLTPEELGRILRENISGKGFKQVQICKNTGLSPSRLSNYLSGTREPDFATLCMIVDAIGITLNDIREADIRSKQEKMLQEVMDGNADCCMIVKTIHGTQSVSVSVGSAYRILSTEE